MKQLILSTLLAFVGVAAIAQTTRQSTITGQLATATPGAKVYLESNSNPPVRLDSATLGPDRTFTLKTNVPDGGNLFLLNTGAKEKIAMLLEGGENLTVSVEPGAKPKNAPKTAPAPKPTIRVSGSKQNDQFRTLLALQNELQETGKDLMKKYQEAQGRNDAKTMTQIEQQYNNLAKTNTQKVKAMLPELGTSLVALYATNFLNPDTDFPTLDTLARKFEAAGVNTPQAKSFIGTVARIRGVAVGAEAPEIALPDTNGTTVALSSMRGKYVLIDFWASWCGPCRNENPNVVRMYNKFKDKGFDILSVSLDQPGKREAWVRAIRNDGLTWHHVSDLKFWQSEAAQRYGVNAIPATFLVDKTGKIIAKNLRGDALEAKLEEVLR
jgi:peroxiredoxin